MKYNLLGTIMSFRILISLFFFIGLTGCEEASKENTTSSIIQNTSESSGRQLLSQSPAENASCLDVCGHEARGTIYSDCISANEDQRECGIEARAWYRECLESRCDDRAIQIDDCRTSCRVNSKEERLQCSNKTTEEQTCLRQVKSDMRTCIDSCQ